MGATSQGLFQLLQNSGQYPTITLKIVPLSLPQLPSIEINTFLDYSFKASVVTPIADFSFTFAYPSDTAPSTDFIHEGDIAILSVNLNGNEYPLGTGIIDTVEVQVTANGETISVMGRDMMGQWEDQQCWLVNGKTFTISKMTPNALYNFFASDTRSKNNGLLLQNIPDESQLVAIAATDTKLQVVTRFLEPFNALAWCQPDGTITWGKPDMVPPSPIGNLTVSKSTRFSNCLSMRATRSAATVPSIVKPVLAGQEVAALLGTPFPPLTNPFAEVATLSSLGHRLATVYISSDPKGGDPQTINELNQFAKQPNPVVARMNAYGFRLMARENMRILQIQVVVPGHVNEFGVPYIIDEMYHIVFDRAGIDHQMYLYQLEYTCSESDGPRTLLQFTYPNTIVAGANYK